MFPRRAIFRPIAATLVCSAVVMTTASVAHAQVSDDGSAYASAGLLVSRIWGPSPATGVGIESTYMNYVSRGSYFPFGGFLQFQFLTDGSFRVAIGAQGAYTGVGAEAGIAYRSRASSAPPGLGTIGLHLGAFTSIGILSAGLRYTIPFYTRPGSPGWEGAVEGTLKYPYRLFGPVPSLADY